MTAIGLALCLCLPAWGDPPVRPEVPPLVLGAESPRSFLVSGHARMSDTMALGFHVAQDGERRLVVVYDLMDQTPLFVSDGRQTLAYDVANSQLVLLSSTRGYVDVQWAPEKAKPLSFSFGVQHRSKPEALDEPDHGFRIDRLVADAQSFEVDAAEPVVTWTVRLEESIRRVQMDPADPSWFRFHHSSIADTGREILLEARLINRPIPAAALAFPQIDALAEEVQVKKLNLTDVPAFTQSVLDGRAWALKFALRAGEAGDAVIRRQMPDTDPQALREHVTRFSTAFRDALAEQGLQLAEPLTTQPSKTGAVAD